MFTPKDRLRYESAIDKAARIGEGIGDFIHVNAKGIVRVFLVVGAILLFGGLIFLGTLLKRTLGKKGS